MKTISKTIRRNWKAALLYGLVTTLILLPLLPPGYILTLDMIFAPNLAIPDVVTSSYLFRVALHGLSFVLPSDVIEKLMLLAILLLSGLGVHRLVRFLHSDKTLSSRVEWGAYASGLMYMINPFTYSRFMAGQYSVLLGYACLPFFVTSLLRFIYAPSLKGAAYVLAWTVGISIVSIHTLGLALVVTLIAVGQAVWHRRRDATYLRRLAVYGLAVGAAFVVASSYWLIPVIQGNGPTAASIANFQSSDQTAFATGGDGIAGKLIHVLRLQGFWAERQGMYQLPQEALPVWGIVVILIWALVIIGAVTIFKHKRSLFTLVATSGVIAALLAAGVGTEWLAGHIPFFAGYREPQKFVALLALSYAILIGFAVPKLIDSAHTKLKKALLGAGLALILVGFTPVMFQGFNGQLTPRQYPADWYAVNDYLNKDTTADYQTLVLPWHLYMQYSFSGRIIANPSDIFFDTPTLVSDDPELGGIKPAVTDTQKLLLTTTLLPQASQSQTLGQQLVPLNVKYILVTKDDDYLEYAYLDRQTDLELVSDTATLKLYRNNAFEKGNK